MCFANKFCFKKYEKGVFTMVKKQLNKTKRGMVKRGVAKIYSLCDKITAFVGGIVLTGMTRCQVYAGDKGSIKVSGGEDLIDTAVDWMSKLLLLPAGFMLILGFVNYASSHSDGDGPGQKKAIGQIVGGLMIAIIALVVGKLDFSDAIIK